MNNFINIFISPKLMKGFSLLELLIVIAIIAIIASAGAGFYMNYGKSVEIKSISETMLFDLKMAQSKSMIGEGGLKWGVHFVNGAKDYYEIFSTPTNYGDVAKVVTSTVYLPNTVSFSSPTLGNSTDIIFSKISGGIDSNSTGEGGTKIDIPIVIQSSGFTKTITISVIGNIF